MSGFNIAANMYGAFPNTYNNQVALNDLCDLDLYSPMAGMGMNDSIFNGSMGMGMGYTPMYGGNYQDYYKNYEKYQDFMIDNQVRRQQKMRSANSRVNSPLKGAYLAAETLKQKVMQNEQQQIIPAFNALVDSVAQMNGCKTKEEAFYAALDLYKNQYKTELTQDIQKYGRDSFTQGMLQTLTLGIADKKTAEENVSELTGQPVSRYNNALKIAGNATGGAIFGAAGAIGLKCLWKGKGPIFNTMRRIPVLAAIGGIAAGIMAFATKD